MPSILPESQTLVLLANQRRRLLCRVLRESTTPLSTAELARHVAEREFKTPSDTDQRTVHCTLHHKHLPRLDNADIITYDATTGCVTPSLHFDTIMDVLNGVTDRERPWSDT